MSKHLKNTLSAEVNEGVRKHPDQNQDSQCSTYAYIAARIEVPKICIVPFSAIPCSCES